MTTTHPDQLAMLAAIRAEPDDDTVRLAYADYLDGLETQSVPCPKCKEMRRGVVIAGQLRFEDIPDEPGLVPRLRKDCPTCNGTGFVLDATSQSNRDRAELIRVQCELAKFSDDEARWFNGVYGSHYYTLKLREKELLAANADRWRKGPVCEAVTCVEIPWANCPDCRGTGDAGGLMRKFTTGRIEDGTSVTKLVEVAYVRGMKRVEVPTAEDVWERVDCPQCEGQSVGKLLLCKTCDNKGRIHHPTAWASAVCLHHPDLDSIRTDRRPYEVASKKRKCRKWCFWFTAGWTAGGHLLPTFLFPFIKAPESREDGNNESMSYFDSAEAGLSALDHGLASWVRSFEKKE